MSLGEGREETPPRGGRDETARQIRAPRSHLVHAHARVVRIATEAHAHHALLLRENRLINRPSVPQVRKKERHRPADGRATDNAGGGGEKVHQTFKGADHAALLKSRAARTTEAASHNYSQTHLF